MNNEKELKRIIRATFDSLDAIVDSSVEAIANVKAEKDISEAYKDGIIDATSTIHNALISVLQNMQKALKPLETKDDCECANCVTRRSLVDTLSSKTGTSKEEMDRAIINAITLAKSQGKAAGAIKVNRTTGEVSILDNSELDDALQDAVDALANGEDVGLEEYKLHPNVNSELKDPIEDLIKDFFMPTTAAPVANKLESALKSVLAKMDKNKTNC